MILFLSDGRLGNQLFQYAFLNTIAKDGEQIVTANMEQFVDRFDIDNINFRHLSLGKSWKFFIRKFLKPSLMFCVRFKIISYIIQDYNSTSMLSTFSNIKGLLPITLVETNFFQSEKFFDETKVDFQIKNKYLEEAKSFLGVRSRVSIEG